MLEFFKSLFPPDNPVLVDKDKELGEADKSKPSASGSPAGWNGEEHLVTCEFSSGTQALSTPKTPPGELLPIPISLGRKSVRNKRLFTMKKTQEKRTEMWRLTGLGEHQPGPCLEPEISCRRRCLSRSCDCQPTAQPGKGRSEEYILELSFPSYLLASVLNQILSLWLPPSHL